MYFAIKLVVTAVIVATVSELAKRYSLFAAVMVSLPFTSILAFIWLYVDTRDTQKVAALSYDIVWMVIPSLLFFLIFPLCIKHGMKFTPALLLSCVVMACGYSVFMVLKSRYF